MQRATLSIPWTSSCTHLTTGAGVAFVITTHSNLAPRSQRESTKRAVEVTSWMPLRSGMTDVLTGRLADVFLQRTVGAGRPPEEEQSRTTVVPSMYGPNRLPLVSFRPSIFITGSLGVTVGTCGGRIVNLIRDIKLFYVQQIPLRIDYSCLEYTPNWPISGKLYL